MRNSLCIALAVVGLWAAPASGDEPKVPWKAGDLTEVEFRYQRTSKEQVVSGGADDSGSTSKKDIEMVYIDRIDAIKDGWVTAVTRHFKKVSMVEDDREVALGLTGRNVKLKRGRNGHLLAAWEGGGALLGEALLAVEVGPWPDVDRAWGVSLGSRAGELKNVATFEWDRPSETPAFVGDALEEFGMGTVSKGHWKITVSGALRPEGEITGQVTLEGRESESSEDGDRVVEMGDSIELKFARRAATAKELPEGAAPPKAEPREDDDPGITPEDEDEPEPMPEPEDEPVPDEEEPKPMPEPDDQDDPMPEPEDDEPEDDEPEPGPEDEDE